MTTQKNTFPNLTHIELWQIWWQLMNREPMAIFTEPAPDILIFVIRGVVLNQVHSMRTRFPAGAR